VKTLATFLLVLAVLSSPVSYAQELMRPTREGVVRLIQGDLAVLESGEARKDLSCEVEAIKPETGYDASLRTGYRVSIPFSELHPGERLAVIFRVTSEADRAQHYFRQVVNTGIFAEDAAGEGVFDGKFRVGEGRYHVNLLVRDAAGRVCSNSWSVQTPAGMRQNAEAALGPGQVEAAESELFAPQPPVEKAAGLPSVKILLHLAPVIPGAAMLDAGDKEALVAMLRGFAKNPRIGRISLVVFNLEQNRVLYREPESPGIDFPALGRAVEEAGFGMVDAAALQGAGLAETLRAELNTRSDAVVFIGPAASSEKSAAEFARAFEGLSIPAFYWQYNPRPEIPVWGDAIDRTVSLLKGRHYTIQQPRDVLTAWPDFISRVRAQQ
jgi:hypothetical protein